MFVTKIRAEGVDDRSPWGDFWFEPVSVRTSSGQRVSPATAMRLSTVFRCLRVLSSTMATLPRCLTQPSSGDKRGREPVTGHWLTSLLRKPNRWQNGFEWHEMMVGHVSLRGTGYNRIVPDGRGGIAELCPLHPDRTFVEMLDNGSYRYRLKHQNGEDEVLPASMVFKIAGYSVNGVTGLSVLEVAGESIGEGLAQQGYSSRFFANDAKPSGGWIEAPMAFKDKMARDTFRESWQQAQGASNRGKVAVLEGGLKFHEISMSNKDAQFLEAKNAKIADICRWFGVPPHLAFALDQATDNNIEQLSLEFIKFTMTDWAERFEAAFEDQLLGEKDVADGLELEYDMDHLARGDMQARAEYHNTMTQGGIETRNEARIDEGRNPLPGLDQPLEPLNMTPAGSRPKPGDQKQPKQDPAPAQDEGEDARLNALTLAIAGRVVRKETSALRRAYDKRKPGAGGEPQLQTSEDFARAATEFYGAHIDYVAECLICSVEIASAWCDRQLEEVLAQVDRQFAGVPELLEVWEAAAAAELAARVQTSAQPKKAEA